MECDICVYYGEGRGKTAAAYGNALLGAEQGESAIIIQFLKSRASSETSVIDRLEPQIKRFRFEKRDEEFEQLSDKERAEEVTNIRNGINFARKVLSTGECDLLILDEILGLLDYGIITIEDLKELFSHADTRMKVILTGRKLADGISDLATELFEIQIGVR